MKLVTVIILAVVSFSVKAQEITIESSVSEAPIVLLKMANESLDKGDLKVAVTLFDKASQFYRLNGRKIDLAGNYLGIALSLAFNGNYSESIRYHKKALKAHRKYVSHEPALEILYNLGLVYQLAGNSRKANKYLVKKTKGLG